MLKVFFMFVFCFHQSYARDASKNQRQIPIHLKNAVRAYQQQLYFTSTGHLKRHLATLGDLTSPGRTRDGRVGMVTMRLIDQLIGKTHIFAFLDIPENVISYLSKQRSSQNIHYLIGKRALLRKDFQSSLQSFEQIQDSSVHYPSALMHVAKLHLLLGNIDKALNASDICIKNITKLKSRNKDFLEYIIDSCEINKARAIYKSADYTKSLGYYSKIPLNSYQFPYSLFEASWGYFATEDYARSVGKSITFQAPVLENYFIPETELVKALNYGQLCLWEDLIGVIRNFDKNIKSQANNLIQYFKLRSKNTAFPFIDLLIKPKRRQELESTLAQRLVNVVFKKPGFQVITKQLRLLQSEKRRLLSSQSVTADKKAYQEVFRDFARFFNTYSKVQFVGFAQEIIRVNNILAEIELDLYSVLKYQVYDKQANELAQSDDLKDEVRVRFSINKLKRETSQHYWNFHGEFWADELGSYIPVLKNQCGDQIFPEGIEK